MSHALVLASTSPYRARLLTSLGVEFDAIAPGVDERALDDRFDELGPEEYALLLARAKASAVARLVGAGLVIGGDQAAVLDLPDGAVRLLHRPADADAAVAQLLAMSGTTHRLVNGLVVIDAATGAEVAAVDVQRVTMRTFREDEARAYVEEFEPYDCAGGYRLEDDADLVESVQGEDVSGVMGLPIPALRRLLATFGFELP